MPHQCCLWQLVVFCFGLWPRFVFVVFFAWDDMQIWLGDLHFVLPPFAFWLLVFAMCCCPSKHFCTAVTWETWSDVLPILFVLPAFRTEPLSFIGRTPRKKTVQICICTETWSDDTTSSSMCTVVTFGQCNPQQKGV